MFTASEARLLSSIGAFITSVVEPLILSQCKLGETVAIIDIPESFVLAIDSIEERLLGLGYSVDKFTYTDGTVHLTLEW